MKLSRAEFEQLALEQLDALYRTARNLAGAGVADDLVQETLVRALRAYKTFDLKEFGIKPWLLRILYNLFVNRLEQERRAPRSLDEAGLSSIEARPQASPEALKYDRDSVDERLAKAVEGLAPEIRAVLLLWAVEDLSYKEIAQVLGIPIGTVMSRLHRARQVLGGELRGLAKELRIGRE